MLEHDFEPTPGMPQEMPDDEQVVWQGAPQFKSLAYSTFHVRKLAVYFMLFICLNVGLNLSASVPVTDVLASAVTFVLLAATALSLLLIYARMVARSTLYTITTKRLVIRTGVAVPVTVNMPFARIERASMREHSDGTGEIALVPEASSRVSYVLMWPLVKPFRWLRVQPVLRGLADAAEVASQLTEQLARSSAAGIETQAGSSATPPAADDVEDAADSDPRGGRSFWVYPTLPLAAAASLVVLSLVAVAWNQLSGSDTGTYADNLTAQVEVGLYFEDREDGSVEVVDAASGRTLDVLAPGTNGFLRSAMRTFVNERREFDIGREVPFVLARMTNGQLLLQDPATERQIDLRAFGRTNAEAFGRFLLLASNEPVVDLNEQTTEDAQQLPTAVALSHQEVNP